MGRLKHTIYLSLFVFTFLNVQVLPLMGQNPWGSGTEADPFIVDYENLGYHTWSSLSYGTPGQTLYYKLTHDCTIKAGTLEVTENGETKSVRVHSFVVGEGVHVIFNLNGYKLKLDDSESFTENDRAIFTIKGSNVSEGKSAGKLTLKSVNVENPSLSSNGAIVGVDGTKDADHYSRRACIDIQNDAILDFESGTIKDFVRASEYNSGSELGCAIYVGYGATVNMTGGIIQNCGFDLSKHEGVEAAHYGGAVYVAQNGLLDFSAGRIENCNAYNGGGVYVDNTTGTQTGRGLKMSGNAIITNCTASHHGGGVFINAKGGASGLTLLPSQNSEESCEISYNRAESLGCGVYVEGPFAMSGGNVHHNYPYVSWIDSYPTIDWSLAEPYMKRYPHGGAVCLKNGAVFNMTGGRIEYNIAASGGGIMVEEGSTFNMNGTGVFSNNSAVGYLGTGNGGAVYVNNGGTFNFIKGELSQNRARRYGGAININQSSVLSISGECDIEGNIAGHGGGVSQESGACTMTISNEGINVSENSAVGCWISHEVYNGNELQSYTLEYKEGNGGGIFIEKGTLTVSAGIISNNTANGSGGGISLKSERLSDNITFNLSGTASIEGNVANADKANEGELDEGGNGGGIDISGVPNDATKTVSIVANITGGVLKENEADNGGAISIYVDKSINSNNSASVTINVEGSSTAVIQSNTATENGGGVMLENGKVTITKGSVSGNSAKNGGGIAVTNGDVTIAEGDSRIEKNIALEKGGGLYVYNNSTSSSKNISFTGGNILENKSVNGLGGGICADGLIDLTTTNTNVKNNTAKNGGGIYLSGGAAMTFNGGLICNNVAEGTPVSGSTAFQDDADNAGVGGGVYLASGTSLKFFDGVVKNAFGLYGNTASTAADDIFARGNETSLQLPKVSGMSLDGFDAPTSELYWVEDYVEKDANYTQGTKVNSYADGSTDILRYRYALRNFRDINKIDFGDSAASKTYTSYVCLALGYEQYFVNLVKLGLDKDDSAIFNVLYKKDGSYVPYRTVLFHRDKSDESGKATASVVLTAGDWKFVEDANWSGKKYKLDDVTSNLPQTDFDGVTYEGLTKIDSGFTFNLRSKVYEQLRAEGKTTFDFTITNISAGNVLPPSAESAVINRIPTVVTQ